MNQLKKPVAVTLLLPMLVLMATTTYTAHAETNAPIIKVNIGKEDWTAAKKLSSPTTLHNVSIKDNITQQETWNDTKKREETKVKIEHITLTIPTSQQESWSQKTNGTGPITTAATVATENAPSILLKNKLIQQESWSQKTNGTEKIETRVIITEKINNTEKWKPVTKPDKKEQEIIVEKMPFKTGEENWSKKRFYNGVDYKVSIQEKWTEAPQETTDEHIKNQLNDLIENKRKANAIQNLIKTLDNTGTSPSEKKQ